MDFWRWYDAWSKVELIYATHYASLLDAGAEQDQGLHTLDSGMTALHVAGGTGGLEMVQLLVENGATIDVAMTGGQIPWRFMPPGSVVNGFGKWLWWVPYLN